MIFSRLMETTEDKKEEKEPKKGSKNYINRKRGKDRLINGIIATKCRNIR